MTAGPQTMTERLHRRPRQVLDPDSFAPRPILYLGSVFARGSRGCDHRPMMLTAIGIHLRLGTYASLWEMYWLAQCEKQDGRGLR
jgi:hypothetical protein